VNLVLKPHKYGSGTLTGQALHRSAYTTALHFVKHAGGQIYIKTDGVTTEKTGRTNNNYLTVRKEVSPAISL
jgi:hypothetical protein